MSEEQERFSLFKVETDIARFKWKPDLEQAERNLWPEIPTGPV